MDSAFSDPAFQAPGLEELQPLFPAYTIEGFIAQGGMGAVYLARQKSLDRTVAIKILPRQFGADPQFRAAFESEAKAMARLNDPNLIGVYDFGDADGMLFIIMEFVKGKSLYHSAHGKAIEQKEAARIVSSICRGLSHAHQAGILHRDIKPSNILLAPGALPKIGDFGLARSVGESRNPDEIVYGTPGYTAPEVVDNPNHVDQRADIFSVGVVLYELLTGRLPPDPWRPPSTVAPSHPAFDTVTRRATHPSPEMRYGDAAEIADELDQIIEKLEGPKLLRKTGPVALQAGGAPPAASKVAMPPKPKSSAPLVATLLLAILAVGGLIYLKLSQDARPPVPPPAAETPTPNPHPKKQSRTRPPKQPRTAREDRPKPPRKDKPAPKEPPPATPKEPAAPKETLAEALTRLQPKLRGGDLTELPPGTVAHAGSHFLLVEPPLSWHQASRFAEDHGGRLAVLETPGDLTWASSQFQAGTPVWLGLSDSGTEGRWAWLTGTPVDETLWAARQPDNTPSNEGGENFAALLPGAAQLEDLPASRPLPFLIQWTGDGTRAGSLAEQIRRTGVALKARRAPLFPAGTRNIDGSRFLLVPHTGSWEEASALATAAGAHLAVPSTPAEAAWITGTLRNTLEDGQACWVGGRLRAPAFTHWEFVTGEKFEFIEWAPGEPAQGDPPPACLQVRRASGDQAGFGYGGAPSSAGSVARALIEWSAPSRRNMPSKDELDQPADAPSWLVRLRQKTRSEHKVAYDRFKRRWDRNLQDFIGDVQSEVDTARRAQLQALKKYAEQFLKDINEAGAIPRELPKGTPGVVRKLHEKSLGKQDGIWEDYQPEFDRALTAYLDALQARIKHLTQVGDREGPPLLTREAEATSSDQQRFHAILKGDFPPVPPAPTEDRAEDKEPAATPDGDRKKPADNQ